MMKNVYWLAIDKNGEHESYDRLVERGVVAQGWPQLGNLTTLKKLVEKDEKKLFVKVVQVLGHHVYGGEEWWDDSEGKENVVPEIMWKLLSFKKGDLIVGIEGTKVRGICEIKDDSYKSYSYAGDCNYAHAVGKSLKWVDWCRFRMGTPPKTSSQGFKGIKFLGEKNRDVVIAAWERVNEDDPWWSEALIEATLKMDVTPRDDKVYFKHIKDSPKCRYVALNDYLESRWLLRNHDDSTDVIAFDSVENLIKLGWVLD